MVLDDFVDSLPHDPWDALCLLVEKFEEIKKDAHSRETVYEELREEYLCMFALSKIMIDQIDDLPSDDPDLDISTREAMERIELYFDGLRLETEPATNRAYIDVVTKNLKERLQVGHLYRFSDRDFARVQTLINELRQIVVQSAHFDEDHRRRMLKRLERLQSELNKRMSDLDRFWGLVGDAGIALGKFGNEAKPFVDRIKELSEIIWRTQAEAEKLPEHSKIPTLPDQR